MKSVVSVPKRAVNLDFDGAVADTCYESYVLVKEAWPRITNGQEYGVSYKDFKEKIRPFIIGPEEFFPLSVKLMDPEKYESLGSEETGKLKADGFREYRAVRTGKQKDPGAYLNLMPAFPGVKDMFKELSAMPIDIYFTSNKDEKTIRMFLDSINCEKLVKDVFDKDKLNGRKLQLEYVKSLGYEPKNSMLYDDAAENLKIASGMGVYPLAAPQGYEIPVKLKEYVKATPPEVPFFARQILGL